MSAFWLFLVAALLYALQSFIYRRFGLRRLEYDRQFSVAHAFEGENVTLIEVLTNRSILPKPWLRIQSRLSPAIKLGSQSSQEVSAAMYHRSIFFIGAFSRLTRRHPVALLHRGYYRVGSVALTVGDLLGIQAADAALNTGAQIAVYPRLLDDADIDLPCSRFIGDLLVRRYIQPDPFLVAAIRPYRTGDSPRDVHWASTARTGELQVKSYDFTADPKLMVLLNVEGTPTQWDNPSEAQQAPIERGISLAATLCLQALSGGAEIGFAANTDLETDHAPALLLPQRSQEHAETLLMLLSRLTLTRVKTFPTFLSELQVPANTDLLILSRFNSEEIEMRMDQLRQSGHHVALSLLEGGASCDEQAAS